MLEMYKSGSSGPMMDRMWGAALTLIILIGVLYLAARLISARYSVKK